MTLQTISAGFVAVPVVLALALGSATASAEVLVLEEGVASYAGTEDTSIFSESTNTNGGGPHLFSGRTAGAANRRALLRYDLSAIPAGSTIVSAQIELTVSLQPTVPRTDPFRLHRLTGGWGEGIASSGEPGGSGAPPAAGDATWVSSFHGTSTWSTPGGDFIATPSATANVSSAALNNKGTWTGTALTQDVQDWIDGTHANHGWILVGNESVLQTAIRFYSSEHTTATAGQRPRLTIDYTPPPAGVDAWSLY